MARLAKTDSPPGTSRRLHNLKRALRHTGVYGLTFGLSKAILVFPLGLGCRIGAWVGVAAFHLMRKEREKTLRNLKMIYGGSKSRAERRALAKAVFRNAGRSAAEAAFLNAHRGRGLYERATIQGFENIAQPLGEGQGVIILSAHYGNWEFIASLLIRRGIQPLGAIARDIKNSMLDRMINRFRTNMGLQVFPRGRSGRDYVRFLRSGCALAVLGDIDTKSGDGIFVPFLGRPAWTQRGIAELARLGRARIIPVFAERDRADPLRHVVRIEPALAEPATENKEEWVAQMTHTYTEAIERAVIARPDLWMWMHRRWRRRPKDAADRQSASAKPSPAAPQGKGGQT